MKRLMIILSLLLTFSIVNAQYECEWNGDCPGGTCIIEQEKSYCTYPEQIITPPTLLPECSDGIIGMSADGKPVCVHSREIPRTICGDNVCEGPESDDWCPEDCLFFQQGGAGGAGGAGGGGGPGGARGGGGGGIAGCGNGILEPGEACENGFPCIGAPAMICDLTDCSCARFKCGDLKIDQGEICDPPGSVYYDYSSGRSIKKICSKDCKSSQDRNCGDGLCDFYEMSYDSCVDDCGVITCTETDDNNNPREVWDKGTVTLHNKDMDYMFEDRCIQYKSFNLLEYACGWGRNYDNPFFGSSRDQIEIPGYEDHKTLVYVFASNCPDGCKDGACQGPLRCYDETVAGECVRNEMIPLVSLFKKQNNEYVVEFPSLNLMLEFYKHSNDTKYSITVYKNKANSIHNEGSIMPLTKNHISARVYDSDLRRAFDINVELDSNKNPTFATLTDSTYFWKGTNYLGNFPKYGGPNYCNPANLQIEDNCGKCGCPSNSECVNDQNQAIATNTPVNSCKIICEGKAKKGECLSNQPLYCSPSSLDIKTDCGVCGCPNGYNCAGSGDCVKEVQRDCYDCATGNFKLIGRRWYVGDPCWDIGPNWKIERSWVGKVSKWLDAKADDITKDWLRENVHVGGEVGGLLTKLIAPMLKWLGFGGSAMVDMTFALCKEMVDVGGQEDNFTCLKSSEEEIIVDAINEQANMDLLKTGELGHTIKRSCNPTILKSNEDCKPLDIKGDSSDKLDVLFITDYDDENIFLINVNRIIKQFERLEPFKSNMNKINFWQMNYPDSTKDMLSFTTEHVYKKVDPLEVKPFLSLGTKVLGYAKKNCAQADQIIFVSKLKFHDHADNIVAWVSFGDYDSNYLVAIHEFGHSFGDLADEYFGSGGVDNPHGGNCAGTIAEAKQLWGDLEGQGNGNMTVGYFKGCSYVDNNFRPTEDSLMRHSQNKDLTFGLVNERILTKKLDQYK